jgi:hypothetical protein
VRHGYGVDLDLARLAERGVVLRPRGWPRRTRSHRP